VLLDVVVDRVVVVVRRVLVVVGPMVVVTGRLVGNVPLLGGGGDVLVVRTGVVGTVGRVVAVVSGGVTGMVVRGLCLVRVRTGWSLLLRGARVVLARAPVGVVLGARVVLDRAE
jgi:hypothetical protein